MLLPSRIVGYCLMLCSLVLVSSTLAQDEVNDWNEIVKILPGEGITHLNYGQSVAISGDTIVVGASASNTIQGESEVYVYVLVDGTWTHEATLTVPDAEDIADSGRFGASVAIDGDTIVVGDYFDDENGMLSGSAYVFTRTDSTWSHQAKLIPSDGSGQASFSWSVAISGNTIVVGAYLDNNTAVSGGSAYVFERNGESWSEQAKLVSSDIESFDRFGVSVDIEGDVIVVGADGGNGITDDTGVAYVFTRNGTIWSEQSKLSASDGLVTDQFGGAVAISGDTIVVGNAQDSSIAPESGAAYIYTFSAGVWNEVSKLVPIDATARDVFGQVVVISGDTVVVGSRSERDPIEMWSGSVYVFTQSETGWILQEKVTASDGTEEDLFGATVALDGNVMVVGASGDEVRNEYRGSIYIFQSENVSD